MASIGNWMSLVDKDVETESSTTGNELTDDDPVILSEDLLMQMRVNKHFRQNTDPINSLDFSPSGDKLVSAAEDDQIIVYDCEKGVLSRSLKSKKYGVNHIRCTHADNAVVHASTKVDDTIRYLSLYDNKYLRYFHGHSGRVTGLTMSPTDDLFISTSADTTLRLWDLRSPNCQGLMQLRTVPVAAMDPEGLVFGVLLSGNIIKLYDLRSFDKGPFTHFRLPNSGNNELPVPAAMKFSPDGKMLALAKAGMPEIFILDAFDGRPLHCLVGHQVSNQENVFEFSFTPDSKFIVSGSEDGSVHFWNAETGLKVCKLNGGHPRPSLLVQFNPKYMMMASACTDMALWIPAAI